MSIQFASSRGGSPVHRTQSALATSVSIRAMTAACAGAQMTVKHEQRLLPVYATSPETGTVMGAPKEKAPLAMVPSSACTRPTSARDWSIMRWVKLPQFTNTPARMNNGIWSSA